jgi:hypothetical protein
MGTAAERILDKSAFALTGPQCECFVCTFYLVSTPSENTTSLMYCRQKTHLMPFQP